jgi:hypothetical protein
MENGIKENKLCNKVDATRKREQAKMHFETVR